jgi:hypothetical protein
MATFELFLFVCLQGQFQAEEGTSACAVCSVGKVGNPLPILLDNKFATNQSMSDVSCGLSGSARVPPTLRCLRKTVRWRAPLAFLESSKTRPARASASCASREPTPTRWPPPPAPTALGTRTPPSRPPAARSASRTTSTLTTGSARSALGECCARATAAPRKRRCPSRPEAGASPKPLLWSTSANCPKAAKGARSLKAGATATVMKGTLALCAQRASLRGTRPTTWAMGSRERKNASPAKQPLEHLQSWPFCRVLLSSFSSSSSSSLSRLASRPQRG